MEGPIEQTDIQRFYKNSTVFLTGATGFIGKLVLEKVLRALPVKKVFILIRSKKEKLAAKRLEDIFESPIFDTIKRNNPDALEKIIIMEGDCSLPMLGLSQKDQKTFIEEVDVVFHIAASVRFDECIKKATMTNIRATKDLITLAKQVNKLKTFVYTGTGFSNCIQREIKEEVYPSKISAENLIAACESLDDECLNSMTKSLIGEWPNTYTFTKQVTEDYINREAAKIPICIARPTIVISTMTEPVAAFVDNVFTLAGFVLATALGFNKITYYQNIDTDIIPADIVVNECIAAGWQTGETFKRGHGAPVYNISTVMDNPIKQSHLYNLLEYHGKLIPTPMQTSYHMCFRTTCRYNYLFFRAIMHTFPAFVFDCIRQIQGKERKYGKGIEKLHKFQESYEYFTTTPILLHVENTHKMLKKMSFQDRQLFNCDVTTINWENYFAQYCKGIRIYLLKDPMSTLPEGRKKMAYMKKVLIASMLVFAIVSYVFGKILIFRIVPFVFGLVLYLLRGVVC